MKVASWGGRGRASGPDRGAPGLPRDCGARRRCCNRASGRGRRARRTRRRAGRIPGVLGWFRGCARFCRKEVLAARPCAQGGADPALGEPESVVRCRVEVADAVHQPGGEAVAAVKSSSLPARSCRRCRDHREDFTSRATGRRGSSREMSRGVVPRRGAGSDAVRATLADKARRSGRAPAATCSRTYRWTRWPRPSVPSSSNPAGAH